MASAEREELMFHDRMLTILSMTHVIQSRILQAMAKGELSKEAAHYITQATTTISREAKK